MNGNGCVLDTNIVIGLFANDPSIVDKISSFNGRILIPSIVLGELLYGAEQSSKKFENIKRIELFAANCSILACDKNTSRFYSILKSVLKAKGKPLPENDLWIAAVSNQYKLKLITRDRHFINIDSLEMIQW